MKTTKQGKVMVMVSAATFIFLAVCFVVISVQSSNENKIFLEHGIRTTATVLALETVDARRSRSYLMTIGMFVKHNLRPGAGHTGSNNENIKRGKNDEPLNNSSVSKDLSEEYQTVSVKISNVTYSKYSTGKTVEVVYLTEDPKNVKLLEEIDGI